jgi:cytochrome P450 PksS
MNTQPNAELAPFNPNSKAFLQNPYPLYAHLRKTTPVAPVAMSKSMQLGNAWIVTRYTDVLVTLKDPRFSNDRARVAAATTAAPAVAGAPKRRKLNLIPNALMALMNSMVMQDDPNHWRLRNLVHKAFTPVMIQQMQGQVEAISAALLDSAARKKEIDLIADFALPLPLTVISEMMGVPESQRLQFHHFMNGFLRGSAGAGVRGQFAQITNAVGLHRFLKRLIHQHQKSPRADLTTALVQAEEQGDRLTEEELIAMLLLLLLAGHETTVNLIGNGMLALLQHRDQFERLKARPELLDSAIDEMLRYTNPVQQVTYRYALEDVHLQAGCIPKGDSVLVAIASANRDETVFENAEQFDIARKPNPHLAFGFGIHYCLGAPLARMEARIAFAQLIDKFPNLQLAVPTDKLEWSNNPALRGLKGLPMRVG